MADYDFDELYPNRFLKGAQFKGKSVTLTITDIVKEELGDEKKKEAKVVLTFKETKFQLVANKLNCIALMLMFGRNTKEWRGKRVTFYPLKGEWFGTKREAVRVLGSPDIEHDVNEKHQLGREIQTFHLKKVAGKKTNGKATAPKPAPEPEMDPDTGEVPFDEEEQAEIHELEMGAAP